MDISWCLGGDFNAIRNEEEKVKVVYNTSVMNHFSQFIDEIGCMDLPCLVVNSLGAAIGGIPPIVGWIDF